MVNRVPSRPKRRKPRCSASSAQTSTMLTSGTRDRATSSSNTMCGVLEESSPCVAPARARRRISSSMYAAKPARSFELTSFRAFARSMLLMTTGG